MFNISEKINTYGTLVKNFTYLYTLQIINYLFPLITLPYLVRVLGPEKFGLIGFAIAFITYFTALCDYGFNLSATKQVSVSRNDIESLNKIFSSVLYSKIILGLFSAVIFLIIILTVSRFSNEAGIYFLSFGYVISSILFPVWFFQGKEEMKPITIINFISKLISTVLIFVMIKDADDYPVLMLIYSAVTLLSGITGLWYAVNKYKLAITIPDFSTLKFQYKQGFQIFISMIAINLYTTTNIFLLGVLVNDTAVGYFSAADKIRSAIQNIIPTISQTVFPHVNKILNESFDKFISFIKKLLMYQTIFSFFISLGIFLFADPIVRLVLGEQYIESIFALKILSVLPTLSSLTTIFAINVLIPLELTNGFMKTFLLAGVTSLITTFLFTPVYFQNGTALAFVIAEVSAALFSFLYVNRKIKLFA